MSLESLKEVAKKTGFGGRWGQSQLIENWDKWNAEHKKGGNVARMGSDPTATKGGADHEVAMTTARAHTSFADDATNAANKASNHAMGGSGADTIAAADKVVLAHKKAASAHGIASAHWNKVGNEGATEHHEAMAKHHMERAASWQKMKDRAAKGAAKKK